MTTTNATITRTSIWVGSYGHYNDGYLVGEWFDLPMDTRDLWHDIRRACKVTPMYEEVGIFDAETDFDGYRISEYDSIDDVNALAAAIERAEDYQLEAASAYLENMGDASAIEAANVIMNADDIAYFPYTVDSDWMSQDERLGYSLLEGSDLISQLEQMGVANYFDYEKYGRDARLGGDVVALEDGYMYGDADVDTDTYTAAEILDMCGYNDTDATAA